MFYTRFLVKLPPKTKEPVPSTSQKSSSEDSESGSESAAEELVVLRNLNSNTEQAVEGPTTKKRKYSNVRKCRDEWQKKFNWLVNKNGKAYCKFCEKFLEGGHKHMERHESSSFHGKNVRKLQGTATIEKCLITDEKKREIRLKKEAQLKMAIHLSEHNLSFAYMEHANKFYSHCFPDSLIAANLNCSRTKMTEIIKMKVAPYVRGNLANKLNNNKFSIIIDETTDISTKKSLAVAVRFFDDEMGRVRDYHFALVELEVATSEKLFSVICNLFKDNQIRIENLLGFASDNASVMMGDIKGVKARFLEILPNLFVMPCISHSLHLCASKACKVLPNDLEKLCHDIYNYFAHSAKRQKNLEEFQIFANTQPHQILRPSQTRWLSLQMVVERICEQWQPLILYFQGEVLGENITNATFILECLNNPMFQIYFKFLKNILTLITKLNTFFQSETPQFYTFLDNIGNIYKTILKFYMKPEIVNSKISLSRINPTNPDYYMQLENIYLGIEAEQFINSRDISRKEINFVKVKCLDFYSKLCSEIRNRIDFSDETLNMIKILGPTQVFSENKESLAKLITRFPNIISQENILELDLEWRQLSNLKPVSDHMNFDELINYLQDQKNGVGEPLLPHLVTFFKAISCLPHSSAAAERLFSQLSLIKTKYRNKLEIDTCDALLLTKQLVNKNTNCFNWTPPDDLVRLL